MYTKVQSKSTIATLTNTASHKKGRQDDGLSNPYAATVSIAATMRNPPTKLMGDLSQPRGWEREGGGEERVARHPPENCRLGTVAAAAIDGGGRPSCIECEVGGSGRGGVDDDSPEPVVATAINGGAALNARGGWEAGTVVSMIMT
jgi:hypothetical protein